jgi:hypothetical protein
VASEPLRLRQTTEVPWDIDGLPGTSSPEAAAQMLPALSDALTTAGSLPDTSGIGTDGGSTVVGTITADSATATIPWLNIPAIVVQTPDFSQAVTDILTANPNPFVGTPNQPTTPVLTPIPNGIQVAWDGLNANGTIEKTPDWDHLEVHVSEDPVFVPTTASLKTTIHAFKDGQGGQAIYATTRYGVSQYVRFVAVARSGASSAPSKVASAQPGQVSALDVGQFALTVLNFKDDKHHLY